MAAYRITAMYLEDNASIISRLALQNYKQKSFKLIVRGSELEIFEMCSNSGLVCYIYFCNYRLGRDMNSLFLSPPGMGYITTDNDELKKHLDMGLVTPSLKSYFLRGFKKKTTACL